MSSAYVAAIRSRSERGAELAAMSGTCSGNVYVRTGGEGCGSLSNIVPLPVNIQHMENISGNAVRNLKRNLSVKTFGLPLSA